MNHPVNNVRYALMAAILAISAMPQLSRADIYVIANAATKLTADDIKLIYTGDKELVGSIKIKPLDNHSAQSEFLAKVLQLNSNRYDSLWTMKSFRDGLTPPATKSSDAEVLAYVEATPGAIGYVTTEPPAGVVVVKKF